MALPLTGVFAAAVTPMADDLSLDLSGLSPLLDHLAAQGCHGALLLGTTGEGPSLTVEERAAVFQAAASWRHQRRLTDRFLLLGGTGCASLPDTIKATQAAFLHGLDASVILPPFYYKDVTPGGLTDYFRRVADAAVPPGARFLAYHIPRVSGVPVPRETISALHAALPNRFAGLKDSSVDLSHTQALCRDFPGLAIFTGTDTHLIASLQAGAAGSITALANIHARTARAAYDAHQSARPSPSEQAVLTAARRALDDYPAVPAIKALLAEQHGLPRWPARPPLRPLPPEALAALTDAMAAAASPGQGQGPQSNG